MTEFEPLKCPNCGATHQINPFCMVCGFPLYPTSFKEAQVFSHFIPIKDREHIEAKWQYIVRWNRLFVALLLVWGLLWYGWWMAYVFVAPLSYLLLLAIVAWIIAQEPGRLLQHYSALYSFGFAPAISKPDRQTVNALKWSGSWKWIILVIYVGYIAGITVMLWRVGYTPHSKIIGLITIPVPKGAIIIWLLLNIDGILLYLIREKWYRQHRLGW